MNRPLLNREVLGQGRSSRQQAYRRDLAVAYADRWWNAGNPAFEEFDVDCTNYVSQCLFAGGHPSTILVEEKPAGGIRGM